MERIEKLEEFEINDKYGLENYHFTRNNYIGDGIFALGTGVGLSGGMVGAYTLVMAGGIVALMGAGFRIVNGIVEKSYNARRTGYKSHNP